MENNVKRILLRRAFCGHYTERRLVSPLEGVQEPLYKDVVRLYPEERELAEDLANAREVCSTIYTQDHQDFGFGSYTQDPPCIWAAPMNIPFGKHWFQITAVDFQPDGICYWLKSIRYFPNANLPTSTNFSSSDGTPITTEDVKEFFLNIYNYILANLNINGVVGVLKFIIILVTTLLTGMFKMVFFVGDFSIKLMREISIFVDAGTPWFLGMLEFASKIIGGFYILLAMIWRGTVSKQTPSYNYVDQKQITYPKRHR